MKKFAFFYQQGLISGELIEACGDRSIIQIDGRLSYDRIAAIAATECKKRGYLAWRLYRGENILRCYPYSNLVRIA